MAVCPVTAVASSTSRQPGDNKLRPQNMLVVDYAWIRHGPLHKAVVLAAGKVPTCGVC